LDTSIANDLLRGARAIADFIGQTLRQTHHKLEKGIIPAGKDGGQWIASRSKLRQHYAKLTTGEAE
jgi:hypothetical protein